MISVDYVLMAFSDVSLNAFDIPKLRGYFARRYPDEPLFHGHLAGNKVSYLLPKIQYRIYQGHPALIGIGEGISAIKKIMLDNHNIQIADKSMQVREVQVEVFQEPFGQSEDFYDYRFITPWMALNQENYKQYIKMNRIAQKQRLKQILRGNLLTLSKGFDYTIPDFDSVELDAWFKPVSRNFHNIPMHCFTGEFTVNFRIPDFLALGKQGARGFGVVNAQRMS
ncbi:MAG: hypothetical protein PWP64_1004 [Candidatus Cloacimonadota bacterium]|nr:hypothetical protein [Candidatus Cloacimonadota bacterium]